MEKAFIGKPIVGHTGYALNIYSPLPNDPPDYCRNAIVIRFITNKEVIAKAKELKIIFSGT